MRSAYVLALLALASCDPVKRLQRDDKAMQKVERFMLARGICRPDTFTIRMTDTLVRVDTVGEIVIFSDTSYVRDTLRITRERLREVLRTLTIRDTLWQAVRDAAREESLVVELRDCRADNEAYKRSHRVWKWAAAGMGLLILLAILIVLKR